MIPDSELPGWLQESRKTTREAAKSLVAYDEWRKNPGRPENFLAFTAIAATLICHQRLTNRK
ncbi:hypothetical protein [Streptomyces violascens]|uniref:Transposase n=1 Tax=Streptomyces violascens TaxID=67381 RepID=A0ABQ3QTD9_9ACTN|nr:hypothetical protein [Streptomyces violascens]GHI40502.1 hypothetical protein Sviol_49100 [Streptomyces violascens]